MNNFKPVGTCKLLILVPIVYIIAVFISPPLEASQRILSSKMKFHDIHFAKIPAGNNMLGCAGRNDSHSNTYCLLSDGPIKHVVMTNPFYMSTTEITQKQWQIVMGDNPSQFKSCGPDCPVENISWNDVQAFISKLNTYGRGTYRLPTNDEWEYAARAGTTTAWSHGDNHAHLNDFAWSVHNSGPSTHIVAGKKPNVWGLYDMHGNVSEMTNDIRKIIKYINPLTGKDNAIMSLTARGGHWENTTNDLRSVSLISLNPTTKRRSLGFRLVKTE
jgi:formylglycine-generating enzyme required for sulfatase activity